MLLKFGVCEKRKKKLSFFVVIIEGSIEWSEMKTQIIGKMWTGIERQENVRKRIKKRQI